MNFMDKFFLWFFMLPGSLYERVGVDRMQLKAILTAKLTMDNRRQSTFHMQNRKQEKKTIDRATLSTMLGALFMGFFMLYSFMYGVDLVSKLTVFMTLFLFMLCITLITDFTSVLIDVRDNFIVLPKPISDATFVTSRLLHITIRTCMIILPLTLPSFVALVVVGGFAFVLPFVLMVLMCSLFSIFLINAVYILILRITTPAKFQSIISYIQIGFTVLVFAGYQLMPRMMDNSVMGTTSLIDYPHIGYFPPYWFARACTSLAEMNVAGDGLICLILALSVPVLAIWVVVRFFAPSFNRKLSMITARTDEQSKATAKSGRKSGSTLPERLAGFLTKSGSEYMGFLFGWKMMARSRDFKMKVYPSFGMVLVLGVVFFMKMPGGRSAVLGHSPMSILLASIYMSCLILMTALSNLPYSEKHKASWLFYSAPVDSPGKVISGAVKSAMVSFYFPVALLLIICSTVLIGPEVLPNVLLGILNVLAIGTFVAYLTVRKLPFSNVLDGAANGGSIIKNLLPMVFLAILGILHGFASSHILIILPLLVLSPLITLFLFSEIRKLKWNELSR